MKKHFLVRYIVQNGEYEYGDYFGLLSDNLEMAREEAEHYCELETDGAIINTFLHDGSGEQMKVGSIKQVTKSEFNKLETLLDLFVVDND